MRLIEAVFAVAISFCYHTMVSNARSQFFRSSANDGKRLACLVVGFTGRINQYKKATDTLLTAGYDVVAFEYDNDVLDKGNPELLTTLVGDVADSLKAYLPSYKKVICTGVSLGAYVAINVQRRLPDVVYGIYGTAGVPVSHVVFTAPVFRKIKKAFVANGFTEKSLLAAWQRTDETKVVGVRTDQSMLVVLGKRDRILPYKIAVEVLDGWGRQGPRVDHFGLMGRGHGLTIRWYKNNLGRLLERAGL